MAENIKKAKIALIDDEKSLVKTIKEFFELRGYDVVTANDGKTGVEVVKKEKPDLIILDLIMPGMEGNIVLQELKKDESVKNIPVIVLTAKHEQFDRDSLLKLGAYEFISKPYKAHILQRQVENVLNKKKMGELS